MAEVGMNGTCHSTTRMTSTSPSDMLCTLTFTFVMRPTLKTPNDPLNAHLARVNKKASHT
ncbi:hypothetical protein GCM10022416_01230 [Actinomadura keratinilytica]|uniref:Uncharacterized protein n=1 Tax=Actinomadura keratinilytica TaxID=547461 RepID=A0ABP7XWB9_9ACTN